MSKGRQKEQETEVTRTNFLESWTSTVINDLFTRFENSTFRGMSFRGISLVHTTTENGSRSVSVNFVFKDKE